MFVHFIKIINTKRIILFLLLIVICIGIFLRFEALFSVIINDWISRDFDRAFSIVDGEYFPLAGPELGNGGRLPGPFMYFFTAIPLLFHKSYFAIFIFNLLINVSSIAILFFTIKKNFNIITASITTALVLINFHHIESVLYPINPSFLFIFISLYLSLILKFIIKKNNISLILLILVLSLSVQFHYSIITYSIAPIVLAFILRLKIPIKVFVVSFVVIIICFIPYIIYKKETFIPTNVHGIQPHHTPDIFSITDIVRVFSVQGTIARIANSNGFSGKLINNDLIPKFWPHFFRIFLSIAFYLLIAHVFSKGYKNALNIYQKELTVLCVFYFPALSYEIYGPYIGHYWYQFIFVLPQSLIIGLFLNIIIERIKSEKIKYFSIATIAFSILVAAFFGMYLIKKGNIFSPNKFEMSRFKNVKSLSEFFLNETKLSPNEFVNNVYMQGFNPLSKNIVKLASRLKNINTSIEKKACYFIHQMGAAGHLEINKNIFLNDPEIKIIKRKILRFSFNKENVHFVIFEYLPSNQQTCYRNVDNPFVVSTLFRSLLRDASNLTRNPQNIIELVTIEKKQIYDQANQLNFLNGNYIIGNENTQVPFRFKIEIENNNENYILKVEFGIYYFWGIPNFKLSNLNIIFKPNKESQPYMINVIPPKNIMNSIGSSNNIMLKEFQLPNEIKIMKDELDLKLNWNIVWFHPNNTCCSVTQDNFLELIKSNS